MKILLISASPRKEESQTFLLANEVLKGCSEKARQTEIIHLRDYRIEFCRHCEECHREVMNCSIKDDVDMILKKILEADGIILASPNYINQVTASMKALFDRSSHFIHCRRLLGKYVAGAVSSGSGQDKDVLDYIRYYALICAAQYSGGVSCRAPVSDEKIEEARQLGKKLSSDIKEKKQYRNQLKIIEGNKEHFGKIIKMRKDSWAEEYQYWVAQGWL